MSQEKQKILERVLKLFSLGDTARNQSEAEVHAAVTKARQLMVEHDLSEADLLSVGTDKAKKAAFTIREQQVYVRKGRTFAPYDQHVAWAVDSICSVKHFISHRMEGCQWYVSRHFYGADVDVAVASKLFEVLLDSVRRAARIEYGSGWSSSHQSYAIGFSYRLHERAAAANPAKWLTEPQSQALVVVSQDKADQIERWQKTNHPFQKPDEKKKKSWSPKVKDHEAFSQGYHDAAVVDLGSKRRL